MHSLKIITALLMLFACVGYSHFSVDPLIVVIEPQKGGTTQLVKVKHLGNIEDPVAIELSIVLREVDIDGRVTYPAGETANEFVVYPAQLILYPGELQVAQVQWTGKSVPPKEITYGMIAEQVPIDLKRDAPLRQNELRGQVKAMMRYEGIVVIRPNGIKPNTMVDSSAVKMEPDGTARLVVVLRNHGTALQELSGMELTVVPMDPQTGAALTYKKTVFKPALSKQQTKHSLFAGFRRKYVFPWPAGVPLGPVQVYVDFK